MNLWRLYMARRRDWERGYRQQAVRDLQAALADGNTAHALHAWYRFVMHGGLYLETPKP